ncbi:hypothetical protein COL14_24905 [Bacillus thuringiensis]|nr:hypothetical protein COL14_24905 [Bacillus thuringiensis]
MCEKHNCYLVNFLRSVKMTTPVMNRPVLKMGSKGPDVAKVQIALQNAGFSPGDIDSNFGLKTDQAVRYSQIYNHLEVDGIVGRHTWGLLQRYYTSSQMRKHKVQQGETFSKLAEIYHVDVNEIINANPGIDPRNLQVGQEVNIPNARGGHTDSSSVAERLETTWNFFKSLGFLDGATAGIMGNLRQESPTLDPHQIQGNDPRKPGRGICQWETIQAGGSGRWGNLVNWANARGKKVYALSTQLEFIWYELNGGDQETVRRLKKYGGVKGLQKLGINDAVKAFQWCFEQAGTPDNPSRIEYAYGIYKRFAKRV